MDVMNMYGGASYSSGYGQPVAQNVAVPQGYQTQQYQGQPVIQNTQHAYPAQTNQNNVYRHIQTNTIAQNAENNQPIQNVNMQNAQVNQAAQNSNTPVIQPQPMKIPHPLEFWVRETSETVLFVEDYLSAPNASEYFGAGGKEYLMKTHSVFSRFRFNIYKTAEKKYLSYNLLPSLVVGLEKKLDAINVMEMMNTAAPKSEAQQNLPPAYTVAISTGKYKGETPAGLILKTAPEQLQQIFTDLESQRNFLQQNVGKYPKNQLQINAINNAFTLYNAQQLTAVDTSAIQSNKIILLDEFKVPNAKQVDQEGLTKIATFKIYYTKGEARPITVEIVNARAKATIHQNGTTTASMAGAKDIDKAVFNMTLFDFADLIEEMKSQKNTFERKIKETRRNAGVSESIKQMQTAKGK